MPVCRLAQPVFVRDLGRSEDNLFFRPLLCQRLGKVSYRLRIGQYLRDRASSEAEALVSVSLGLIVDMVSEAVCCDQIVGLQYVV